MAALYPRYSNRILWTALAAGLLGLGLLGAAPLVYVRTPYHTGQFQPIAQPVDFDHRHHVRDDHIDCLYCHASAEDAAVVTIPSAAVCMGCHAQIWNRSPLLARVREAYYADAPIHWQRVHHLPDFVYFHHGAHVRAGIACAVCHGDVGSMAAVYQQAPLSMGWCLECHRHPGRSVELATPLLDVQPTDGTSTAARDGRAIHRLTTCTACHR